MCTPPLRQSVLQKPSVTSSRCARPELARLLHLREAPSLDRDSAHESIRYGRAARTTERYLSIFRRFIGQRSLHQYRCSAGIDLISNLLTFLRCQKLNPEQTCVRILGVSRNRFRLEQTDRQKARNNYL